jgi:hypothetical protein
MKNPNIIFLTRFNNPIFVKNSIMITSDQIKDLNTRLDKLRHYL